MPANQRTSCVFLVAALLVAQACENVSECGDPWHNGTASDPQYELRMYHEQPRVCPIPFTRADEDAGGKVVTFEAWTTSKRNAVIGVVTVMFFDANGGQNDNENLRFFMNEVDPWTDRGDVIGSYVAGRAGLSVFGRMQADQALMLATVQDGRLAEAGIGLTYGTRYAGQIAGASDVEEGSGFSLAPQVNDPTAVYPITYQWYQDGAPMGPPTQDESPVYVEGQPGGSTIQFHIFMTDAAGYSYQTPFHNVWVYYTGGCDEPPCSR